MTKDIYEKLVQWVRDYRLLMARTRRSNKGEKRIERI